MTHYIIRLFLVTLLYIITDGISAQSNMSSSIYRNIENINSDWQYIENNTTDVNEIKNAKEWSTISLPHTWNQWDAVDNAPGYRRDASWYRKELDIDYNNTKQYKIYFEGVNISSVIYLNGVEAGRHVGGYVGFEIDITDLIIEDQANILLVRADNSYNRDVIPSQKADFFIYGGITRDVWLKIMPTTNIENVRVSTPQVSEISATTTIDVDIHSSSSLDNSYSITSMIIDPITNASVSEKNITLSGNNKITKIELPVVKNPKLWSPDNPHLYRLITQLKKDNRIIDVKEETIGYRWFSFEEYGAFFLNGKRLLLRGTHRHEEHAGYGAAMPNELHRRDIEQIKDIGANFLRLGHYPQDPEVYKACNELGLIVWDELPWCRGGIGTEVWQTNTRNLLTEQIHQNYNHPSILFWSLGNEIYWLPDFDDGDNEIKINAFLSSLHETAHTLDSNRMTAIRKYYAGADLVDVFSPSIWSGWYSGVYTNYEKTLLKNQKLYPRFLHMEYGGSSHVGRHTEEPMTGHGSINDDSWEEVVNQVDIKNIAKDGDWTENYIVDLFDWHLSVSESSETFSGNAQWAFKDFGTPLRPENAIPYLNQKGLVDRSGQPKDAYYVYKSYWSDVPFTYIESHTWTHRQGPENESRNISVFSNCNHVELLHNKKSVGKKKRVMGETPACGLNWDIKFQEGDNLLIAHGYDNEVRITSDTMTVHYTYAQSDKADHIQLSHRMLSNGNYLIEATMLDKNDQRVLNYENYVYFSKDGNGTLLQDYGTPTRSQVIEMANGYAAIELTPAKKGKAIIEARNQDFKGSYLIIDFEKDNIPAVDIGLNNN